MGPAAAKEMRVFGLAGWFTDEYVDATERMLGPVAARRRQLYLVPYLVYTAIGLLVCAAVLVSIARSASAGDITLTALALGIQSVVAAIALGEYYPESDVQTQYGMQAVSALAEFEARMADAESRVPRGGDALPVPADAPSTVLRFEDVHFSYPGSNRPVLDGLDLELPAGLCTAIVGVNGAGKTTLVKLLTRLHEPTAGRLTVDGTDLADLDVAAWRRQVSVVFQDFVRYELSASDNILVGAVHAPRDPAVVRRAAERAGIADAVDALPAGFDTTLSRAYEGGADLSGGQWQRIAIARSLYALEAGARVLVLDEPTSALDVRAEAAFFDRFVELTRGVTSVLISHRFSSVRRADRIVVIDARAGGRAGHARRARGRRRALRAAVPAAGGAVRGGARRRRQRGGAVIQTVRGSWALLRLAGRISPGKLVLSAVLMVLQSVALPLAAPALARPDRRRDRRRRAPGVDRRGARRRAGRRRPDRRALRAHLLLRAGRPRGDPARARPHRAVARLAGHRAPRAARVRGPAAGAALRARPVGLGVDAGAAVRHRPRGRARHHRRPARAAQPVAAPAAARRGPAAGPGPTRGGRARRRAHRAPPPTTAARGTCSSCRSTRRRPRSCASAGWARRSGRRLRDARGTPRPPCSGPARCGPTRLRAAGQLVFAVAYVAATLARAAGRRRRGAHRRRRRPRHHARVAGEPAGHGRGDHPAAAAAGRADDGGPRVDACARAVAEPAADRRARAGHRCATASGSRASRSRYPGTDATRARGRRPASCRPGTSVAIVGENGAGKTTLVKLLCRFYAPTTGTITVDGVDLRRPRPRGVAGPHRGRLPGLLPVRAAGARRTSGWATCRASGRTTRCSAPLDRAHASDVARAAGGRARHASSAPATRTARSCPAGSGRSSRSAGR